MRRFKPGQHVVCIRPTAPYRNEHGVTTYGPKFNEVVTVCCYSRSDITCVVLHEYSEIKMIDGQRTQFVFGEHYFEPLVDDEVLREELKDVRGPFTISRE